MPLPTLDPVEVRVAGALIEKALATPEYYPMTLNALVAACNQKTGRDPVTAYTEREVGGALERLSRRGLAGTTSGSGHRVAKFRHNLDRALDLSHRELAALAVLLLRGPQTPGEVRSRSGRMAEFENVEDAEEALWMLGDRDDPLVVRLDRAPGQSADRFAHRLSGEPEMETAPPRAAERDESVPSAPADAAPGLAERVDALEARVAELEAALQAFRSQFE